MNKGLEAFDKTLDIICCQKHDDNLQNYIDIVEKELKEYEEIKTYMQQYEIENVEELRRVLHNNWVINQKFKTDTANVARALEIIKNKGVFVHLLQQSKKVEEYNSLMLIAFKKMAERDYKGAVKKFCLTQEEFDLLKNEVVEHE